MLTITNYGEGKCTWCLAHGEGVQTTFKDGLTGFLCRKHFWEALKARSEQTETRTQRESRQGGSPIESSIVVRKQSRDGSSRTVFDDPELVLGLWRFEDL